MKKLLFIATIAIIAMAGCKEKENEETPTAVTLEYISVTKQPTKKTYNIGDTFDTSGMTVAAVYSDGTTVPVTITTVMLSYNFSTAGTNKTVTITYEGKTTTVTGITVNAAANSEFFDGSGTGVVDPYLIETAAQLAKLAELINARSTNYNKKYYKLTADIDLSAYGKKWNDGKGWIPIGTNDNRFMGKFDGNNQKVIGLYINDNNLDYAGLFGSVGDEGNVTNLGVDGEVTGRNQVGSVAGTIQYYGRVTNCYATGVVSGNNYIGGIVGSVGSYCHVTNCYTTGAVSGNDYIGGVVAGSRSAYYSVTNCYATGVVSGNDYIGGIAGCAGFANDVVSNCYATGAVNGRSNVGGVAGYTNGRLTRCYATGTVSGTYGNVGGVAGIVGTDGSVTNCYATGAVSGISSVGGVAGIVSGSTSSVGTWGEVINCAALNPSITRASGTNTSFGRVVGYRSATNAKLSNNVAWSGMAAVGGITFGAGAVGNQNGADITTAQIKADGTLGGRFTEANGWSTENGKLPGFGVPVALPAHLE